MGTRLAPDSGMDAAARAGFERNAPATSPYLFSSEYWLAEQAGRALRRHVENGHATCSEAQPVSASKSRGYSVRVLCDGRAEWLVLFETKTLDVTEIRRLK